MCEDRFDNDAVKILTTVAKMGTVAVIGLEKNTGKTETLNYLVRHLHNQRKIGVTSIGTDGEEKDLLFGTEKPPVFVSEGMLYTTTEAFYRQRTALSEIHHVSERTTPTGRLIIARALQPGRVVVSGPTDTDWMRTVVQFMLRRVELVFIDGALSRFTQASPSIADGVILATGAAFSLSISEIVKQTKFIYSLLTLPKASPEDAQALAEKNALDRVCLFVSGGEWKPLDLDSALQLIKADEYTKLLAEASKVYVPSALTDGVLRVLRDKEIVVKDFTKCLFSAEMFARFRPKIVVFNPTTVIGVTVNPLSPTGYRLDSSRLREEIKKALPELPVIDVRGD